MVDWVDSRDQPSTSLGEGVIVNLSMSVPHYACDDEPCGGGDWRIVGAAVGVPVTDSGARRGGSAAVTAAGVQCLLVAWRSRGSDASDVVPVAASDGGPCW